MIAFSEDFQFTRWDKLEVGLDGRVIRDEANTTTFCVRGSFQPENSRTGGEMTRVGPELLRTDRVVDFYTAAELRLADQKTGAEADQLIVDGEKYVVRTKKTWRTVLPHFHYQLVREDRDESVSRA